MTMSARLFPVLIGCSFWFTAAFSSAADPAPARDSQTAQAWLDHGRTADERDRVRAIMNEGISRGLIPGGSVLILHRGEVVFREAFGVADLASRQPFTVDAPCRIASVTKPHTSTLMAMLVEEGRISWEDPVDKHLPFFKGVKVRDGEAARRVPVIRELLSHTAGFPGNTVIKAGRWPINRDETLKELAEDIAAKGLVAEPGTAYAYSRLGYMVAGRIAEVVSGVEFGQLMKQRLLDPIGAKHATFHPSDELLARVPTPYERVRGTLKPVDVEARREAGGKVPNPGGGLVSTLDDVAKLALLHRNKGLVGDRRLVAEESLRALYKPQPASRRESYAIGFHVEQVGPDGYATRVRHVGASGPILEIDFTRDLAVVVFTQVPQSAQLRDRVIEETYKIFDRQP